MVSRFYGNGPLPASAPPASAIAMTILEPTRLGSVILTLRFGRAGAISKKRFGPLAVNSTEMDPIRLAAGLKFKTAPLTKLGGALGVRFPVALTKKLKSLKTKGGGGLGNAAAVKRITMFAPTGTTDTVTAWCGGSGTTQSRLGPAPPAPANVTLIGWAVARARVNSTKSPCLSSI